jgi:hypothetical protein
MILKRNKVTEIGLEWRLSALQGLGSVEMEELITE